MILDISLLIIGFILLIKSADILVSWASSLAVRLWIPPLIVGLTIVAMGTSSPELAVNIFSAIDGKTDLALWNIIGSNIANILIILGLSSIIYPITAQISTIYKEIPFSLLAVIVLAIIANDRILNGSTSSELSRGDWLILLSFFTIFLYYIFSIAKENKEESDSIPSLPAWKSAVYIIGGLVGLTLGGKWIVDSAVSIASTFGISDKVIGITIVAVGTSLPELATSLVAAWKKQSDIAIGNVIGSNIFNIFLILGITSLIAPIPLNPWTNVDIFIAFLATIIVFMSMFIGKKHTIDRVEWAGMFLLYIGYILYLFLTM